jgi:histidinol-phosphate aminotransferase
MNRTSICCGVEAVKDDAYFKETTAKIVKTREWAKEELKCLGFSFTDSMANFIFAAHESVPAKEIFAALREADIYVRYFNSPRIDNYLRITIGTEGEMERLFEFLRTYLKK